jgi:hypothetical protein
MERNWIVGLVRHQHLHIARTALRDQGYRIKLPKFYRHPKQTEPGKSSMGFRFGSRYIFIEANLASEIAPINHTRGMDDSARGQAVIGTWMRVGVDDVFNPHIIRPAYLAMLEDLQEHEFHEAIATKAPEPRTDLVPGDPVMIIGDRGRIGYGQEGRFQESARGVAIVLCGNMKVVVPDCDLKKVEQEQRRAA